MSRRLAATIQLPPRVMRRVRALAAERPESELAAALRDYEAAQLDHARTLETDVRIVSRYVVHLLGLTVYLPPFRSARTPRPMPVLEAETALSSAALVMSAALTAHERALVAGEPVPRQES